MRPHLERARDIRSALEALFAETLPKISREEFIINRELGKTMYPGTVLGGVATNMEPPPFLPGAVENFFAHETFAVDSWPAVLGALFGTSLQAHDVKSLAARVRRVRIISAANFEEWRNKFEEWRNKYDKLATQTGTVVKESYEGTVTLTAVLNRALTEDEESKVRKSLAGARFQLVKRITDRIQVVSELPIVFAYRAVPIGGAVASAPKSGLRRLFSGRHGRLSGKNLGRS